jgi:hypothetical protein
MAIVNDVPTCPICGDKMIGRVWRKGSPKEGEPSCNSCFMGNTQYLIDTNQMIDYSPKFNSKGENINSYICYCKLDPCQCKREACNLEDNIESDCCERDNCPLCHNWSAKKPS